MLDEKTKEWLFNREVTECYNGKYFCNYCKFYKTKNCQIGTCWPIGYKDYQDAAEFEARVAAKLAVYSHDCGSCKILDTCNGLCEQQRIKHARIEVEEEMENES